MALEIAGLVVLAFLVGIAVLIVFPAVMPGLISALNGGNVGALILLCCPLFVIFGLAYYLVKV